MRFHRLKDRQRWVNKLLSSHKLWLSSDTRAGKQLDLVDADFREVNLEGADLRASYLPRANLEGANLQNANLEECDLYDSNLSHVNFEGANLKGANLHMAFLQGANLKNCNLRETDLHGTDLFQTVLPEKIIKVGDLYNITNQYQFTDSQYYEFTDCIICLLSINSDNTIDFIENNSGKIHRGQPNWFKFSMEEIK